MPNSAAINRRKNLRMKIADAARVAVCANVKATAR
jgi:hypothetical protein